MYATFEVKSELVPDSTTTVSGRFASMRSFNVDIATDAEGPTTIGRPLSREHATPPIFRVIVTGAAPPALVNSRVWTSAT